MEFSDDGEPESREKSMSIGTLTLWNFGAKVRSRDYHYPLHLVSANEKDKICKILWKQHTDEMELIESYLFKINGEKVKFEFLGNQHYNAESYVPITVCQCPQKRFSENQRRDIRRKSNYNNTTNSIVYSSKIQCGLPRF